MSLFLITGASGFLGSQITKHLLENDNNELVLICRNIDSCKEKFANMKIDFNRIQFIESSIEKLDVSDLSNIEKIDYIIHCAAPTKSKYMINHPIETADAIILGTKNILDIAKEFKIKSMVNLSSMEVYGFVDHCNTPRSECELGELELYSPRSCYPESKRIAEHYCHIYNKEYNVPVKTARLSQVFGKGSSTSDTRVFMQFAKSAYFKKDIILKTNGKSRGNYCSTEDTINAIMCILFNGENGSVYNVANESISMSIIEMAKFVASNIANNEIDVRIEEEDNMLTGYAAPTNLWMSSKKLQEIGWFPQKDMKDMYQDIINTLNKEAL